ncbi:hypothetical protein ACUSIJ_00305 [Pseudochelatococcus sp. B33]
MSAIEIERVPLTRADSYPSQDGDSFAVGGSEDVALLDLTRRRTSTSSGRDPSGRDVFAVPTKLADDEYTEAERKYRRDRRNALSEDYSKWGAGIGAVVGATLGAIGGAIFGVAGLAPGMVAGAVAGGLAGGVALGTIFGAIGKCIGWVVGHLKANREILAKRAEKAAELPTMGDGRQIIPEQVDAASPEQAGGLLIKMLRNSGVVSRTAFSLVLKVLQVDPQRRETFIRRLQQADAENAASQPGLTRPPSLRRANTGLDNCDLLDPTSNTGNAGRDLVIDHI